MKASHNAIFDAVTHDATNHMQEWAEDLDGMTPVEWVKGHLDRFNNPNFVRVAADLGVTIDDEGVNIEDLEDAKDLCAMLNRACDESDRDNYRVMWLALGATSEGDVDDMGCLSGMIQGAIKALEGD